MQVLSLESQSSVSRPIMAFGNTRSMADLRGWTWTGQGRVTVLLLCWMNRLVFDLCLCRDTMDPRALLKFALGIKPMGHYLVILWMPLSTAARVLSANER